MIIKYSTVRLFFLSLILSLFALFLLTGLFIWPQEALEGAKHGLELWATVLVPSLLPFFIMAEILLGLGIVKTLGILMEPLMRPFFKLPGSTAFVVAMGFTSGYPMGAILTRRLHEEKLCSTAECERLVAFTNNSSPVFILVAVAVGMFGSPELGLIIAFSHYTSNIMLGIILGLLPFAKDQNADFSPGIFKRALSTFLAAQKKRKPLGTLLGDGIKKGINNITLIGGFVVLFAVIIKLLSSSGLQKYLESISLLLLHPTALPDFLSKPLATGFWEMTLGLKEASLFKLSLQQQAAVISLMMGWSGLSIQAQVVSILSGSNIRTHLYHICRILQGLLSALLAYALASTKNFLHTETAAPVFNVIRHIDGPTLLFKYNFILVAKAFVLIILVFLFLSAFLVVARHLTD